MICRIVDDPVFIAADQLCESHGDLRAEAGTQAEAVYPLLVIAARAQVEVAEVGVRLPVIRDRRHLPCLERLDHDRVLDPRPHRVAGEALRVGDEHVPVFFAERGAERFSLGRGAPAASGRVGLMRHENRLVRDFFAACSRNPLNLRHEPLHDRRYVIRVEPGDVIRAVVELGGDELRDGVHAAFFKLRFRLDHDADRAHAGDHAVSAPVERERGVLIITLGGHRAEREKRRQGPLGE